jgi:hypothetical protein
VQHDNHSSAAVHERPYHLYANMEWSSISGRVLT